MPIEEVVEKYLQLIKTEHFAKYEKDFASRVQKGLIYGYLQGMREPDMLSVVENIINNLNGLSVSTDSFKIFTKSIFIHGNRSQVKFEYYGKEVQKELGDLIFILSVIYNGRKYFEKFTISQFKKDDNELRWNLSNKEQIYLLSRFPSFKGVKGIIPKKEHNLPNYFGCLGSFNLLFRPGDSVFISAQLLESLVGNRRSINIIDIYKLWEPPSCYFNYSILFDRSDIDELFYICLKLWRYRLPIPFFPPCCIGTLGFSPYAPNIHDFVDKYLRGCIGDLIYSYMGMYNKPAFDFLQELLSAIMRKAKKEKRDDIINFVNEFSNHPYRDNQRSMREGIEFDDEGGGMGIIYTLINLGEGRE